jgi:lipid-A-disaccharide synthase
MTKKIFIIAGEASGDFLGASLMRDLKALKSVEFTGIGGPLMTEEGLSSLFPMRELSIMGLVEVLKYLPLMIRRLNETVDAIVAQQPDILITVDSPDFCLRVAKRVKKKCPNIKIVHYVAPTVWAWRPKRAEKIAKFLDGLLCLFPFEPPYFTKHGLKAEFAGHPLVKTIGEVTDEQKRQFFETYDLDPSHPVLCMLPGSRRKEVSALWPIFLKTAEQLRRTMPDLQVILPTLPHLLPLLGEVPSYITLMTDNTDKYIAFQCSDAALHASGTVALELALSGVPMVTTYKVNPLTAFVARRLLTTRYYNLVNILHSEEVVPELVQEKCTPEILSAALQGLLADPQSRSVQMRKLVQIRNMLGEPKPLATARFVEST